MYDNHEKRKLNKQAKTTTISVYFFLLSLSQK